MNNKDFENKRNEYIKQRNEFFAQNIDEFEIGEFVIDKSDKTNNTIEVFIKKKTNKGIDCKQYFNMQSFNKKFKKNE